MKYATFGEFEIPRRGSTIDKSELSTFWDSVESTEYWLSNAVGCYLFAIRAGAGIRPWYVGRSTTGFRKECFASHKLVHYTEVIAEMGKGTPVMILVARLTATENFARAVPRNEIDFVEKQLIYRALERNPDLKNVMNKKFKGVSIPGFMNNPKGPPTKGASALASTLGLR